MESVSLSLYEDMRELAFRQAEMISGIHNLTEDLIGLEGTMQEIQADEV